MDELIKQFKKKAKGRGIKYVWFVKKYLPEVDYNTFIRQINGYAPLSHQVKVVLEKYIMEEL